MAINHVLVLVGVIAGLSVASQTDSAHGHGCQAQGGCCMVGACSDMSVVSPIYMMFAAVGAGDITMFGFYRRPEHRTRLGMIFNIFC